MDDELRKTLLLAQYNQMWEWKRFNIRLCWQISTMLGVVLGVAAQQPLVQQHPRTLIVPFVIGMVGLFARHNFFQGVIGHLISHLEEHGPYDGPLPKTGPDFREFCNKHGYDLNWWFGFGGWVYGYWYWIILLAVLVHYLYLLTIGSV